jgi:hypothetical protein
VNVRLLRWLVGVTPPLEWISPGRSPWLIAEVAAAVVGTVVPALSRLSITA